MLISTGVPYLYLAWLSVHISPSEDPERPQRYYELLRYLNDVEFEYGHPMDENRVKDGYDLRDMFLTSTGYPYSFEFEHRTVSVLEVLVALSARCENDIMGDPSVGDRTCTWFWAMISNLGLDELDNEHFNVVRCEEILRTFMYREYGSDGNGGPFYIPHYTGDLRKLELWVQLNHWLTYIIRKGD
ncbi:MAG: hypothetical protein KBT27_09355 [Prevotellaceae bacterium]|nr:hypothetical protein [Candidatus Faecinaster equi]